VPLYAAPSAHCAPAVLRTAFSPPGKFLILLEDEYRNEKSFRPCPLISRFCCFPGTVKTVPYKAKMDAGAQCAPLLLSPSSVGERIALPPSPRSPFFAESLLSAKEEEQRSDTQLSRLPEGWA